MNFSYLDAAALKRLGRFYNVPEAQYGCSVDELAYAVASAFMREVGFSTSLSPVPRWRCTFPDRQDWVWNLLALALSPAG